MTKGVELTETCPCGAEFTIKNASVIEHPEWVSINLSLWRSNHAAQHTTYTSSNATTTQSQVDSSHSYLQALDDLSVRLEHTNTVMRDALNDPKLSCSKSEEDRLAGKVEGITLAISNLREVRKHYYRYTD